MKKLIGSLSAMGLLAAVLMAGCNAKTSVPTEPVDSTSTFTMTSTPVVTSTQTATRTFTLTPTGTATKTVTGTTTGTPTQTATSTASSTATSTATATVTSTATVGGQLPVNLNSASTYAVLAFSDVTNSGATSLCGNLGVWSGTAWGVGSGYLFGCGGVVHATDTPAQVAQGDLTTAYDDAMGRTLNPIPENNADLGGLTLAPGLYKSTGTLAITGNLKLDGGGDPNSVWIFQVQTSMTTAVSSTITLAGSAKASNIFWQVGTSATLGGTSTFEGTLMAGTLIAFGTGIDLEGRALSLGEVTLLTDIVNAQAP